MANITTSNVNFQGDFRNDISPAKLRLTDLTDYAGVSFGAHVSRGIYQLIGPDGITFYKNAGFDTNVFTGFDTYNWQTSDGSYNPVVSKSLPLDVNGNVLQGTYTIIYKVEDNAGLPVTITKTFLYQHTIQSVEIQQVVDCFASSIVSNDTTNYAGAEGAFTLSLDRSHKLYYPQGLNLSPQEVTGPQISLTPIYDQTWTTTISTIATYTFANNFTIIDLLTGSKEILVNCDENLCGILCGLEKLNDRYLDSVTNGRQDKDLLFYKLNRITQLMNLFGNAQKCGQGSNADMYLKEIFIVGGFDADCGCADSDIPKLIVPLYNVIGGATIVVQNGSGILVVGVLSGGTMTYTVSLASAYKDKIDNLYNTVLTSVDNSVTIVPNTSGYIRTYDLHVEQTTNIPDNSIATAKYEDLSITTAKIALLAITADRIANHTITNLQIAAATITAMEMAANSVGTTQIANSAVTGNKIAAGAITETNMAAGSVGTPELINNSVTRSKIANQAINTALLDSTLTWSTFHCAASFEDNEIGNIAFPIDASPAGMIFPVTGVAITIVVTKQIEASNNGSLTIKVNPGGVSVTSVPISIPAGSVVGTTITVSGPLLVANIPPIGTIEFDTAKTTHGGRVEVFIYYTRG